jgi:ABC-type transport system, involved in lipoprotein release, permease component
VQKRAQRLLSIDQWQKIVSEVREVPGVKVVSPTVAGPAFAVRGDANRSVSVSGIVRRNTTSSCRCRTRSSRARGASRAPTCWWATSSRRTWGRAWATRCGSPRPPGSDVTLTITGIFDLGSRGVNERNAYVLLRTAQDLLNLPGGASSINVTVDDVWAAEDVAQRISARVGLRPTAGSARTSSSSSR